MTTRIDTRSLKEAYPIEDIVGRYGIELRPSGRSLIGRCPFHVDRGRPNLAVYPASRTWYCFRCGCGGDAISFVQRMEGLGFRDAVARIQGTVERPEVPRVRPAPRRWMTGRHSPAWGPDERACLAAAVEIYHNRLLSDDRALAYVEARGLDLPTLERHRVGYASGDELAGYLRWRGLPLQAAARVGLVRRDGREFLAGRVVVPEIRAGQPVWLIGRSLDSTPYPDVPKYLGLPGRKPLLGWESTTSAESVWLTEGVFDWLTLRRWGLPAVALVGTHAGAAAVRALSRFPRIYLALDSDAAGQAAAADLVSALGPRAMVVQLPGVKDVADLATLPNGDATLLHAVGRAQLAAA
ncbi:MAG: toprim domain-containing protein [Chloroflexi bacterium]|nr:toprim domain-containing protein [Chloroflexota bacterium]